MAKSNNEINKEIMYRKIMPTGKRTATPDPVKETPPEAFSFSPIAETASFQAPKPPSVNRTSAASRQIEESRDMILVNVMEDLVLSRLDTTLARFNCCKCNKCKKDIAAIALNRLTPRYMVVKAGDEEKRRRTEEEFGSAVTSALIQAILIVKKSPRH